MGRHDVDHLRFATKSDGLTTLGFTSGVGLLVFVWPLQGALFRVFLQYFTILLGLPRYMQQACFRRSAYRSDGLHNFSCDLQRGPSWV